ncbi:alpha-2-HS-glycoprotein [Carettochelys insculpta]|uniref:alpha-2-HS-glycoprotein n=1 Tax=Carettochelys insculpta TaxID=44489 RepID=UPI003EB97474
MKALVALLLLIQLMRCKAIPLGPVQPLRPRVIDCDDPESEEAAAVALNYINSHHPHGYKYALNSIENVVVLPRRPHGEVFSMELDLLETLCHVVNPLPIEKCTVRPLADHAVEGDCDVKLLKVDGQYSVLESKCHSTPDSAEDVIQVCPDCPLLAVLNDTKVVNAVHLALSQHNRETDGAYLRLVDIGRAQIQQVSDIVSVEVAVVVTNCSAKDAQDHVDDCHPLPEDLSQFGFCEGSVTAGINTTVSCVIYEHQAGATYDHLIKEHLGGNIPSLSQGFQHHDLWHFHRGPANDTSESSSHEAAIGTPPPPPPPPPEPPVVKRDVGAVLDPAVSPATIGPVAKLALCPGNIRHFQV